MVKTLDDPSREEVVEAIDQEIPVKITNYLRHYPDLCKLTPQYLAKKHGNMKILLNTSIVEQEMTNHIKVSLRNFVDLMHHLDKTKSLPDKNYYFAESMDFAEKIDIEDDLEEFMKETCQSPYFTFSAYSFWLAPRGTRTGLHYDIDHRNLLMMFHGEKVFYLADPRQSIFLYPSDKFEHEGGVSQVDIFNPDYRRFPLFANARFLKVHLKVGEILFIPANWWHAVENLTSICAVGCRFETLRSKFKQMPEWVLFNLHRLGLYKKGNCTCCSKKNKRWT